MLKKLSFAPCCTLYCNARTPAVLQMCLATRAAYFVVPVCYLKAIIPNNPVGDEPAKALSHQMWLRMAFLIGVHVPHVLLFRRMLAQGDKYFFELSKTGQVYRDVPKQAGIKEGS